VWLEKTQPDTPDTGQGDGYAMARGRTLEGFLADRYRQQHPDCIVERPPALLAHPDMPWLLASLDRLAHYPDRTVILEMKTTSRWDGWVGGTLPDHVAVQVLTQLAVTGLPEAHVVADVCGSYQERTIYRDEVWEAGALPILHEFWHTNVLGGVPPEVDFARDRIPDLNRVWQPVPGSSREPTAEELAIVERLWQVDEQLKPLTTSKDQLRVELRTAMRTDQALIDTDGRKVAWLNTRGTLYTAQPTEENQA